jgi:hypothetical protein
MSYSHYYEHERMREHYEDYMDQKRKDEQQEKSDDDYYATHTTSGTSLDKLVHVTNIPYREGGFAAVNWCPVSNQFLICEPGREDWAIDRTESTLRAFAQIIAFNPKMWGCSRCGCSSMVKDYERICWCDACQTTGCCISSRLAEHIDIIPRAKSQYFMKRRGSLPPPPIVPLERQVAVGSSDTLFEPPPISPKSVASIHLSTEDLERFISQ